MPTFPNHRFHGAIVWLQFLLLLLVFGCVPTWAGDSGTPARLKVSDIQAIEGRVSGYAVSPDGSRVVYTADPRITGSRGLFSVPADGGGVSTLIEDGPDIDLDQDLVISNDGNHVVVIGQILSDVDELYSVSVLGSAVVRLNLDLQVNSRVRDFALAGSRAIYRAAQESPGVDELYSVPIGGGTVVKLNGALAGGDVQSDYQVSADGSRVIYRAAQEKAGVDELYSAPADGSAAAVKLNGTLASSDITQGFVLSPDGSRVIYRAAQDTSGVFELYSAPIDGSAAATQISGDLVEGGDVAFGYLVDPSSSRVIYQAEQDTDGVRDLYSVPITGGMTTKLTDAFVAGGAVPSGAWAASPQRVAFIADRDTDDVLELYTVPIDGGTVVKVSGPMVDQGDVDRTEDLAFTGDGNHVIYVADQIEDGRNELFSSPAAGGGSVKLNGTLAEPSSLRGFGTFGTSSVWYWAAQDVLGDNELYRVPADGSVPAVKVNDPLPAGGDVREAPTVTATHIIYLAEQDTIGVPELFAADLSATNLSSTELSGGVTTKLNDPIVARRGQIRNVLPTPDGQRVVYRGEIENGERDELFSADLTTGQITQLASTIADGNVSDEQLSSDGTRVVYRAPQDERDVDELYSISIAGGEATRLNPDFVAGGEVRVLVASPSTDRVVYVADQEVDGTDELYSVPIAGGPVVKLNESLPAGGSVSNTDLIVSPSGATTIFRADQNVAGVPEFFAVATTGGPTVDLSSPMTSAFGARIAPDESRVVYFADEDTASLNELYSVPLSGGPSVKLNDPLPDGGTLQTGDVIQITSDSAYVVYRGEQITDGATELFSVPIAGGPVTRLNADLSTPSADIQDFLLTPDGTRVIYRGAQDAQNVLELYSVPVTGGTPIKLNPPLPPGGFVARYEVSPTGDRVAFVGEVETVGVREIFSVPVDGGTVIKLNGPLAGQGPFGNGDFGFSSDGLWVVYLAERDTPESPELFWVRATGGSAAKINGPLVEGGLVSAFWMAPDSASVFYTAEEEVSSVRDLWYAKPLIFFDGFESGDTSAWTNTVP